MKQDFDFGHFVVACVLVLLAFFCASFINSIPY